MDNQIQYALVWKEVRQIYVMVLAFIILSFGLLTYMYIVTISPKYFVAPTTHMAEFILGIGMFFGMGLAYILAAGNRLLEASQNLESFLFTKPIDRKTTIQIYYLVSLLSWLVWFFAYFFLIWFFNMFCFSEEFYFLGHITELLPETLFCTLLVVLAHGLTFCTALIAPYLVSTAVAFIGTMLIGYIILFVDPIAVQDLLRNSVWLLGAVLIAGLIAGSLYLYNNKQVS